MQPLSRREFVARLTQAGVTCSFATALAADSGDAPPPFAPPDPIVQIPDAFRPRPHVILVSDEQLEALQDPDAEVDLSVSATPHVTTLRRVCEQARASGARRLLFAFDAFWEQYRPGQRGKPRALTPDQDEYIRRLARISETVRAHGLGLELSLLSPLEIGPGYARATGEAGRWVQYREGWRDPASGRFGVALWQPLRWTNNKGVIELERTGVRVFAFREQRVPGTAYYHVDPAHIVELRGPFEIETSEPLGVYRRLTVRGAGETQVGPLDRVLVVVSYRTPEMDYFSPRALPFLKELVERYHRAGIPLQALYSDEVHIQQDWNYFGHHDEGQFTFRYVTPHLAAQFAERYGAEFADFDRWLVYFCYGQHGFYTSLEARWPAQHVMGADAAGVHRTFLLRRRYYDLLHRGVVDLFQRAREHAERIYGHKLVATAHATWAESPTCDAWRANHPRRTSAAARYEYTAAFVWSNTVQQAASACDDYFRWGEFLTGGGTDHAEGGWSDRNYYGLALACSLGSINPHERYAYAAGWGWPAAVAERYRALRNAYGAGADAAFQAVEGRQHRDIEVLMLYPLSLVACEERFGSWMVQYGYANYITPEKLLELGRVTADGHIELCGRRFGALAVLFEPLPPPELLPFLEEFVARGGRLVWSGPPPRLDFGGGRALDRWQRLCGVRELQCHIEGIIAAGGIVEFSGALRNVPPQTILTDFLVDWIWPVEPDAGTEVVARVEQETIGVRRVLSGGGSVTFLGFRPRDDQAASLGYETRTWFEVLRALGAYPGSRPDSDADNPTVVSRESPYLATRFPNGAIAVAAHYRRHVEAWPGGFHRDAEADRLVLEKNPLPDDRLDLRQFRVAGRTLDFQGRLVMAFRMDARGRLAAFAGYDCASIRIDGRDHVFADAPLPHIAWAPVPPERRVPGGAVMEFWVRGQGALRIPLPEDVRAVRLFLQGARPDSAGAAVPAQVQDGELRFRAEPGWGAAHGFVVPV